MDPLLLSSAGHNDHPDHYPASPHSNLYDISPHLGTPYDAFDIPLPDTASHFPHTPSYNGSYQNSPYSNYSDLPPIDGSDEVLGLLVDNPSGISITEEYDPADYEVPSSGGPLILNEHFMNGTHTFKDSLSFHSPAWPSGSLPDDRRSPPLNKPQSPPQLVIPDTTSPGGAGGDSPPIINAPDGDGGLIGSGPTLQIVPATPVSGGGVTPQAAPFRDTLGSMQSGGSPNAGPSDVQDWAHHQHFGSHFADQPFSFPGSGSSSALADDSAQQRQAHHQQQQYNSQRGQQFLLPQAPQRTRSLSDTSLRPPPVWDTMSMNQNEQRQGGTVNMNDVLPGPGQGRSSDPFAQQNGYPGPTHPSSAGPHQTTFGNPMGSFNPSQYASDFLTVDGPGTSIRRAKSDGGRGHTRGVRSLDIRPSHSLSPDPGMLFPPPGPTQQEFMRRQFLSPAEPVASIRSGSGHHRRSSSGSRERGIGGMIGMGAGMGMGGGLVAGWTGSSASSARASPYPSPSASPRPGYGALPSSHDVGLSGLGGMGGMGMGMGMGMGAGAMGGMQRSLSGQMGIGSPGMGPGDMMKGSVTTVDMPGAEVPINVTRPHVTTPSTAAASHGRRKQPANFACPVPGCGSTFTRHFNLKGHMRSHAEEKPYLCKWPGCGKGFARQHDCKRHEQLHLNIRPYPCEGCKKHFARMDALNRHHCRKVQEELVPGSTAHLDAPSAAGTSSATSDSGAEGSGGSDVKPDPDGGWSNGGMMM
ncbi:hypothetical protein BN946_scf184687.g3 [Trametes cinnabarina]|uniref:C2H2-type domain-containing protein n=1 Tax=Pycnoporus cinnabarinus TaxID=5643 RepID=A0A060SBF4_PYCCI|nr:hypothetical protein BN946_scf184687.g3 [Trametes cinnabarina]